MRIIVMGVSGAGKTTIGRMLAERLGYEFADADEFHSAENKAKMSSGIALTDGDRGPWLESLSAMLRSTPDVVLACSALKSSYRKRLSVENSTFVYLRIDADLASERLRQRSGHFFDPALLTSQFEALEPPRDAIEANASQPSEWIVDFIVNEVSGRR